MSDTTKLEVNAKTERPDSIPQIHIRSGVRAGGASGPCDIAYWRKELNYWRDLAEKMGCA